MAIIKRVFKIILAAVMMISMCNLGMLNVNAKETGSSTPTLNIKSCNRFKGDTYTLKVNGSSIKSITWSTSNKKVAKVSSKGKVTAVSKGSATIYCKVKTKKSSYTLKSKVTIMNKPSKLSGMKIKSKDYYYQAYNKEDHDYLYKTYKVITAYSKSGKKLWSYKTGSYWVYDSMCAISKMATCNNMVYVREEGTLIALDMKTGKIVWKSSCKTTQSYNIFFDQDGNCYLLDENRTQLYSFDSRGNYRYKVEQYDKSLLYPYKLVAKGSYAYVYFMYRDPDRKPRIKYTKVNNESYYIRIKRSTGKVG